MSDSVSDSESLVRETIADDTTGGDEDGMVDLSGPRLKLVTVLKKDQSGV